MHSRCTPNATPTFARLMQQKICEPTICAVPDLMPLSIHAIIALGIALGAIEI